MEIIKVTLNHHPGLQEALNTTADPTRRVSRAIGGEPVDHSTADLSGDGLG
jgi:hypothetical protein